MQRRTFLKAIAATPLTTIEPQFRQVRRSLCFADETPVQIIVTAHPNNSIAERYRRKWIPGPFEGFGEWYLDSSETRILPQHLSQLPGTLRYHMTTMGAAAERRAYLVESFRRDHVSYIVRMVGDHEELMIDIAEHFVEEPIPGLFETVWNPIHLSALIPGTDDLGRPAKDAEFFWP